MNIKKIYQSSEKIGLLLVKGSAIIAAIVTIVGVITKFINWGAKGPFSLLLIFIHDSILNFWLLALPCCLSAYLCSKKKSLNCFLAVSPNYSSRI